MSDTRWWDHDPDERPVPMDAVTAPVERAAEEIVEAERRALMREDTEPTLQTLATLRQVQERSVFHRAGSAFSTRLAVSLLLAGCVAMFSLGWSQGLRARSDATQGVMQTTPGNEESGSNERSIRSTDGGGKEVSER